MALKLHLRSKKKTEENVQDHKGTLLTSSATTFMPNAVIWLWMNTKSFVSSDPKLLSWSILIFLINDINFELNFSDSLLEIVD